MLVIGYEDTSMDMEFLEKICDRNLVYTSSIVAEIPVGKKDRVGFLFSFCSALPILREAFPIRSSLASGFSYWM